MAADQSAVTAKQPGLSGEAERVSILGATGSIGVSTLNVLAQHPDRFKVHGLAARCNADQLLTQCRASDARIAVLTCPDDSSYSAAELETKFKAVGAELWTGSEALEALAADSGTDTVMAAIVGAAGLPSALAAAQAGKRILLANKEALVMSGELFMRTVETAGATLLPIDSEHNAVFQCMPAAGTAAASTVRRIVLTASGGPFRELPTEKFAEITPEQAVAHPNWSMGQKISVDSATLMNKGLEVIEAHWLFGLPSTQIDVVVHPQSTVHSMVEYEDGSVLAQLGAPDMRTPIAHALAWPERLSSGGDRLDILGMGSLDFEPPDEQRFPCLRLAREAMETGGAAATVLNAANEVAVAEFLTGRLAFNAIAEVIEKTLQAVEPNWAVDSLETILAADDEARRFARAQIPS